MGTINQILVNLQDQYEAIKDYIPNKLSTSNPFEMQGGSDLAGCLKEAEMKQEFLNKMLLRPK